MVETVIQVSYLVLPDNNVRVCEVALAGTVTSANEQIRNQQIGPAAGLLSGKAFLQSECYFRNRATGTYYITLSRLYRISCSW